MSKRIKIKKGLDIKLFGEAERATANVFYSATHAVKPPDFMGFAPIPKLLIAEGDEVKAGTPLFYDKKSPEILVTAPVSGRIKSVKRGAKRSVSEVIIEADREISYIDYGSANPNELTRDEVELKLLKSGVWAFIRQRPYNIIACPEFRPKAIFISAFDTSPLAPDYDYIVHGKGDVFQTGLDALRKLIDGKVHLNIPESEAVSDVFRNARDVQINTFTGPHPAGNVGIQIHHVDPINKGDIVWYLNPQDVLTIGHLFAHGKYDATRYIALTGSEVKSPKYFKTFVGANIQNMIDNNLLSQNCRYISGNVLTGRKIEQDGHIGYYDCQVSVIPEGDYYEFMGWAMPGFNKMSVSRSFPAFLFPNRKYKLDTNYHGEERAYVVSGQYEKVLPMDILPVFLIKAILTKNIDKMEQLGIYEVCEEDFALCEFVCTSKIEVQKIIREGLDLIRKEME